MNNRTTYQAKIVKPDGLPLEAVSVNFKFTILDPSASCILYSEEYSAVNMQNTGGLIFFSLGAGNRTYPTSGATTLESVLDNSVVSFACQSPGLYVPTSSDNRKIVMQFNDGNGWQTLPAMAINAVPYAMYAGKSDNAVRFNGKSDTAFVEYASLASLSCNPATHAIAFNGVSFSCIAVGSSNPPVTSSTVIAALGYTPAQDSNFTSLDSTVTSVSSALYSVSSTVSNLNNSVTSLSNSVAASLAAMTSSQWQNVAGGIKYASGAVTIGDAANNALMTMYTPDSGSVSHGLVLIDRNAGYGSWQNPSGLDGVSANSSGTVTGWGQLYFNYYSSGSIDFNRGGGYSKFNGGVAIGMPMPAARLHIGAGTSSTAPLRFVAGTLLSSAAAGAIEYDGIDYYFTDNSNTRRSLSSIAANGVTSSGVISSLGYTPADNANVTSLTSVVATSFTTIVSSLTTIENNVTSVSNTLATLSGTVGAITSSQWTTSGTNIYYNMPNVGNVAIGTTTQEATLKVVGTRGVYNAGNSTYRGGGKQNFYNIYGDEYGNGSFYTYGVPDITGGGYWVAAGRAGAYIKGGDGLSLSGGGAGVVAIGGSASGATSTVGGGAGIFAQGGLNGDGTRTYAGYFEGNVIVNDRLGIGIGATTPTAKLDVSGTITMGSSSESISTYVNTGAAYTIADTNLNIRRLTLTGNATVTLPAYAPSAAKVFTLTVFVRQDGAGARTVIFTGTGADTIKWDSGSAPSISTTPSKITILQFTKPSDETVWYGSKVWQED